MITNSFTLHQKKSLLIMNSDSVVDELMAVRSACLPNQQTTERVYLAAEPRHRKAGTDFMHITVNSSHEIEVCLLTGQIP